jgi:trehalose synthase
MQRYRLMHVEDYKPFVGEEAIKRIRGKAKKLQGSHVVNVNSTYYGGGVSQLLSSLTLLMNSLGIKTGWRVIHGPPDFFSVTKKIHNALQGGKINLTSRKKYLYETVVYENAVRNHLDHDLVIVHDPQPLPLIDHYRKKSPWVWRCHIDLSNPHQQVWDYLVPYIEKYDAVILSSPDYAQKIKTPAAVFPAGDRPFHYQQS